MNRTIQPLSTSTTINVSNSTPKTISRRARHRIEQLSAMIINPPSLYGNRGRSIWQRNKRAKETNRWHHAIDNEVNEVKKKQSHAHDNNKQSSNGSFDKDKVVVYMVDEKDEKVTATATATITLSAIVQGYEQKVGALNEQSRNAPSNGVDGLDWSTDEYAISKRRGERHHHNISTLISGGSRRHERGYNRRIMSANKSEWLAAEVNDILDDHRDVAQAVHKLAPIGSVYHHIMKRHYQEGHADVRSKGVQRRTSDRAAPRRAVRTQLRSNLSAGHVHGSESAYTQSHKKGSRSLRAGDLRLS